MEEQNDFEAVKAGAAVMYAALNSIYQLHEETPLVEGAVCRHCSKLADGNVAYPCPTVQILFNDFIGEESTSEMPSPVE
jgi:hypothetical protein